MANKLKIRKGDRVKVIAGRSKGKIGDVLRVIAADERVVVSGVTKIGFKFLEDGRKVRFARGSGETIDR